MRHSTGIITKAFGVLVVSSWMAIGCGGNAGSPAPVVDASDVSFGQPETSVEDQTVADLSPEQQAPPPDIADSDIGKPPDPQCRKQILVLADDPEQLRLPVQSQRTVTFQVVDYAAGGPGAGLYVHSDLSCDEGLQAQLSVVNVVTSQAGQATIQIVAGDVGPGHCQLTLATECADDAVLDVLIEDLPRGDIRVEFLAQDLAITLHHIKVRVIDGGYACSHFDPTNPPDEVAFGDQTAASITGHVTFYDLAVGNYTLYATALGPTGHLAGAGCIGPVAVSADEETPVDLALSVLALRVSGNYDMVATFDFTGAIPGQAGEIINWIVTLFYDPGQFMIDLVVEIVDIYLGQLVGSVAEWLLDAFSGQLTDLVNDWIFNSSPEWVQQFFTIGQDIVQIVKNVELLADLKISKLLNDYTVQGVEEWKGLALYWHLNCLPEDDPNYNPDDCRWSITLNDLSSDPNFPMDLIAGYFTATVANYDDLIVNTHPIELNYGRLILYVLNYAISELSGGQYTSILELVQGIVNCQGLGDGVVGDLLSQLGISNQDVTQFCENAIVFLVAPATSMIQGLAADSRLRLRGSATLVDDDDDLVVDRIIDGEFTGTIEANGMEGSQFEAVWHATRKGYTLPAEN